MNRILQAARRPVGKRALAFAGALFLLLLTGAYGLHVQSTPETEIRQLQETATRNAPQSAEAAKHMEAFSRHSRTMSALPLAEGLGIGAFLGLFTWAEIRRQASRSRSLLRRGLRRARARD